ncbi:MAG: GNAT family N-acetyltransferase [Actinomycetes bacterium]
MADASVRPARAEDAQAVATVQLRVWRSAYAEVVPSDVLGALSPDELADRWAQAAASPPSARHLLLVACEGADVVGFAAVTPAEDDDADAADAELAALLVDPDHGRAGHGSRLLAAAVESMREQGVRRAQAWLLSTDDALRALLTSAGWAPDGATRDLDMGRLVHQVRLHADVTPDEGTDEQVD